MAVKYSQFWQTDELSLSSGLGANSLSSQHQKILFKQTGMIIMGKEYEICLTLFDIS